MTERRKERNAVEEKETEKWMISIFFFILRCDHYEFYFVLLLSWVITLFALSLVLSSSQEADNKA